MLYNDSIAKHYPESRFQGVSDLAINILLDFVLNLILNAKKPSYNKINTLGILIGQWVRLSKVLGILAAGQPGNFKWN